MNQDQEERKMSRYEPRSRRKESIQVLTKIKKKGKYPGMNQDQEKRKVSKYEPRSRRKESIQV